jgi:UDP-glucose 4-epimerase
VKNRGKCTVLVTGGCGFIGSHVVDRLIEGDYAVVVLDDLSTGILSNLNQEAVFYQGDVSDEYFVSKIFEQHKFDYVIHEATTINTNALHEMPLHDLKSSSNSTIILAENCVQYNVKNFIFASSVAVYGRPESLPASENSLIDPIYSYGIAKYTAESYLKYFYTYYGLNYQILRYANVFGPRQPIYGEVGIIAIYTDRFINGEDLIIFGDGEHQRDYIYVTDIVDFTLKSMQFSAPDTYNIGRGIPVTVNEVFAEFQANNLQHNQATYKPERYGEIGNFYSNIDHALSTGWRPKVTLKSGIKETIDYFKKSLL